MASQDEDFMFGWSDHADNFAINFGEFLNQKELIDVTLFADGQFFPAHRLVLSALSPHFRQIFAQAPANQQTFVYMKDVSKQTMDSLMTFMYKGEVDVKRDLLVDFMNTAQALKIKGLADDNFSFKPSNQQQQSAVQSVQYGAAVHGAMQYQSSQLNRNCGPAIPHRSQPAAIRQQRSMNENRIGLPAMAMSNGLGINPYAMRTFNDGDRGYGLKNDYESDDDQAHGNGKHTNGSSDGNQVFANGSKNDVPNAKRPKHEPNVNVPNLRPAVLTSHNMIADMRMNHLGVVNLFSNGNEFYEFGSLDGEHLWLCPKFDSDKCQAAISTINVNGVTMMKVLTAEHSHGSN